MAFVPGYDNDVFISYAHVDNEPIDYGGISTGWVTCLKQQLQKLIDQQLGRKSAARIWMDLDDLAGNESVTPTLDGAVRKTATLVVVLSNGYLRSQWCKKEIQSFVEAARSDGRLFVIHHTNIALEERPEEIRDINGFNFFDTDLNAELHPSHADFRHAILRLKARLARKLEEMQQASDLAEESNEPAEHPPAILLAEVTQDLQDHREALRTYIEKLGYRILPSKFYRRGAQEFQEMLDKDLAESRLFIQLLGQFGTLRTEDLPEGYEGLQLIRAKAANIPMLRSYGRDAVDLDQVTNDLHRSFLEASDVMALDLEEFKVEISNKLRELSLQERRPGLSDMGDKPVLINALSEDLDSAYKISNRLDKQRVRFELIEGDEPLEESAKICDPAGLVLVYGEKSSGKWIKQQMRSFMNMKLARQPLDLVCALYFDPPEKRNQMHASPPAFFRTIDSCSAEPEFEQFIHELRSKVTTP